jgi:AraC-like DNA-binding protein
MIPPTRAVYVPPSADHELTMRGYVEMRTLYLAPTLAEELPRRACALDVRALLRELLMHIVDLGALESDSAAHQHIVRVLLDQVLEGGAGSTDLPMPRDMRARRVAERVLAKPGEAASAAELAANAGASLRTLQRLFRAETARSFDEWRTRARLLRSAMLLTSGHTVTQAALLVGYQSLSAFITAYRKAFGVTPGQNRNTSLKNQ